MLARPLACIWYVKEMKFDKTSEHIIRFENFSGYFLIREFQYDDQTSDPIAEFIKTRYISWKEEFRNEVNVTVNNFDQLVDWNFHGPYNIKKLRPEHFKKVTAIDFVNRFREKMQSEIGIDKKIIKAQYLLNKLIDLNSDFYIIGDISDDILHEWSVFDFFISGFKISKDLKMLTAIECGLD
jgi:hypothetical protein